VKRGWVIQAYIDSTLSPNDQGDSKLSVAYGSRICREEMRKLCLEQIPVLLPVC
jgi:hypothetical protein